MRFLAPFSPHASVSVKFLRLFLMNFALALANSLRSQRRREMKSCARKPIKRTPNRRSFFPTAHRLYRLGRGYTGNRITPTLALLVLLLPVFGLGSTPTIITSIIYTILPVAWNTYAGLTSVNREHLFVAESIGLSEWEILTG